MVLLKFMYVLATFIFKTLCMMLKVILNIYVFMLNIPRAKFKAPNNNLGRNKI